MHVLSSETTSQSTETRLRQAGAHTHTHSPNKFQSVAIGNPLKFDGLLLVLRGCKWSSEATQGGTNNRFIMITPQGATSLQNDEEAASDVSFLCSSPWRAENQRNTTCRERKIRKLPHILYMQKGLLLQELAFSYYFL